LLDGRDMTTARTMSFLLASASLAACTVDDGEIDCNLTGRCDEAPQTCDDVRYGNGTCDLQLSCGVPDIDCFRTFENDAAAGKWWTDFETESGGTVHALIPESDARFQRVRAALDKGWAAFKKHRSVGKLADARPGLVLIDMPLSHAAFVMSDSKAGNQPFTVMVELPALEAGASDDALLGVMMHELQHALGLHLLGMNGELIKKFYVAPSGSEPIGREQKNDANVEMLGRAWIGAATSVGPLSNEELGGMPTGGEAQQILATIAGGAVQAHPDTCMHAVQLIDAAQNAVSGSTDLLAGTLAPPAGLRYQADEAMDALKNECIPDFQPDLIAVMASMNNLQPADVEKALDPHDLALIKGKHAVDGLSALVADRRATMRDSEAKLYDSAYESWSQLRYFSVEEDADDVSVFVMSAAKADPASINDFFHVMLPEATRNACDAMLASALPPYGADLTDSHHAICWRMGHVQRLKAHIASASRTVAPVATKTPGEVRIPKRLLPEPRYRIAD
jgi:hypothetical protein